VLYSRLAAPSPRCQADDVAGSRGVLIRRPSAGPVCAIIVRIPGERERFETCGFVENRVPNGGRVTFLEEGPAGGSADSGSGWWRIGEL